MLPPMIGLSSRGSEMPNRNCLLDTALGIAAYLTNYPPSPLLMHLPSPWTTSTARMLCSKALILNTRNLQAVTPVELTRRDPISRINKDPNPPHLRLYLDPRTPSTS